MKWLFLCYDYVIVLYFTLDPFPSLQNSVASVYCLPKKVREQRGVVCYSSKIGTGLTHDHNQTKPQRTIDKVN